MNKDVPACEDCGSTKDVHRTGTMTEQELAAEDAAHCEQHRQATGVPKGRVRLVRAAKLQPKLQPQAR